MANLKDTIVLGNLTVTGKINGAIDNSGGSGVSVINANPTLAWSTQSTVATIGGTAITLTMPANPVPAGRFVKCSNSNTTWSDGPADLDSDWYKMNSFMGSVNATGLDWQNIINIRHRGGSDSTSAGDNHQYGLQIRSSLASNDRLYYRHQYSSEGWKDWVSVANLSDIKNPTDYYWANVKVSSTSNSGTSPTFKNMNALNIKAESWHPYRNSGSITIGANSMTGSEGATSGINLYACDGVHIKTLAQDGNIELNAASSLDLIGYYTKLSGSTVDIIDSNGPYFKSTATGWSVPANDTYGCIYPAYTGGLTTTGYGYLGYGKQKWWRLHTCYIGESSNPCNYGYFTALYKGGSSVTTSDIRLKNNITNTTLEALPIINNLHILNYQLNDFTKQQERLKRQKEKARITMARLPKTKENRKLRKELQEIISTPNLSTTKDIGVSAQELESLLPPEFINTFILKESTHNYSDQRFIKDDNLIYLVIKGIQEQQNIINSLEERITRLEELCTKLIQ